jgi:hypothetical protein
MSLPLKIKFTILRYIIHSGKKKFNFVTWFFILTKYKINMKVHKNSDTIFFINFENITRYDHLKQFMYLYHKVDEKLIDGASFIHINRVINWNIIELFSIIVKNEKIFKIFDNQAKKILEDVKLKGVKKIIVFCDTVPLQNYLCETANKSGIETFSLQHGFYISDENKVFELVYKASNANKFFVWDKRSLFYLNKHNHSRNYIKAGPFQQLLKDKAIVEQENPDKNLIAIYSCGKDQVNQNFYLIELIKYFEKNSKNSYKLIAHPRFSILERFLFSFKNKVFLYSNKNKLAKYDIHFVLNSAIWLELEQQGEKFYLLNDDYENNTSFDQIKQKVLIDQNLNQENPLKPFFKNEEALNQIIKHILI